MKTEVTLALLLGVILAPYLPCSIWEGVAAMSILIALSFFLFHRDINSWYVLVLSIVVFGFTYSKLRAQLSNETTDRPPVSAYVIKAEKSLTRSRLSPEHQHVLSAMLMGDRQKLTQEQKLTFRNAGAQHLLALSGLHLAILTTLLYSLILRRARFTRWRWPALLATLFLLWWYAFMVGMPMSLMRASLMYTLFIVGQFSNRGTRGYEILSSTVFLMLLIEPQCAFDIGAQLSVAALVGLTLFAPVLSNITMMTDIADEYAPPRFPWLQRLWSFVCVSFSAWLFTMPLIIYYFQQLQVWQPLVSTILVPATSILLHTGVVVVALSLLGSEILLTPLSILQDLLMDGFDWILSLAAALPYSTVNLQGISVLHVLLLYGLFAILGVALKYHSLRVWLTATFCCVVLLTLMMLLSTP